MKKRIIVSLIAILLTAALIPMNFASAVDNGASGNKFNLPSSWKVTSQQIQAQQVKKLQDVAAGRSRSAPMGKGLVEEGVSPAPALTPDNVRGDFKADANGMMTAIIGLVESPVGAMSTTLSGVSLDQVSRVDAEQQVAIDKLKVLGDTVKVTNQLKYAYNGFALSFPKEKLAEIQALYGVENVHPSHTYYADLPSSVPLIGATNVWTDPGFKGEGMVVGVVDTGVDYTHPDLGGGFGNKVIGMINTAEGTDDAMDLNGHGTHVAGTMAANAEGRPTGVTGVAPEAKILAAKIVVGGGGSAESSWLAAGFDWMLEQKLSGINVASINCSFGSPGGWRDPNDVEQIAIQSCIDHGIFVSLSAGNEYYSVYPYNQYFTTGEDPNKVTYYPADIGISGGPSVSPNAAATAASWNTYSRYFNFLVNDPAGTRGDYTSSSDVDPIGYYGGLPQSYVYVSYGNDDTYYEGKDVTGKIALILRGGPGDANFTNKLARARDHGASGALVMNDAARGDALLSMTTPDGYDIPALFTGYTVGSFLRDNPAYKITFDGGVTSVQNLNANTIVDFSSWGTDNNLFYKPDLSAPGGGIWSTVPVAQGSYANYSGTSMAAPHTGGAAALIKQAHPEWTVAQIKTALQNTGTLLYYYGTTKYDSPRHQGTGRINVDLALKTPVFVTDAITGLAAVTLGDTKGATSKTFTLEATNTGDEELTYDLSGTIQRYNSGRVPYALTGASLNMPSSVTVPPHSSVVFDVTLDLSENTTYENIFVDGFITLAPVVIGPESITPPPLTPPVLHIPYVLFWGDWQDTRYTYDWIMNPVIDPPPDDPSGWWWWGYTWSYTVMDGGLYYLGMDYYGNMDREIIAISPNGDGVQDNLHPLVSFMRGTPEFEFNIYKDYSGEFVTTAASDWSVPKNYNLDQYWSGWNNDWMWDPAPGSIPDGSYYSSLKAEVPGTFARGSGQYDMVNLPVIVDTVNPVINILPRLENIEQFAGNDFTVNWTATDDRSGIWGFQVWLDGSFYTDLPPDANSFTFTGLPDVPHSFLIAAVDNAGNIGFSNFIYDGFELTLPPGWNFFSMPGQTDWQPAHVLAPLPSGYVLRWFNEFEQRYWMDNFLFLEGEAYWLMLRQAGSFTFSSVLNGFPYFEEELVPGRNDKGIPYPMVYGWDEIKVQIGSQIVTMEQAIQMNVIRTIWYWQGESYVNQRGLPFFPGYGYMFNANGPCTLLYPNPYFMF